MGLKIESTNVQPSQQPYCLYLTTNYEVCVYGDGAVMVCLRILHEIAPTAQLNT